MTKSNASPVYYKGTRESLCEDFPFYQEMMSYDEGVLNKSDYSTLIKDLPRSCLLNRPNAPIEEIEKNTSKLINSWLNNNLSAYVQGDISSGGPLGDAIKSALAYYNIDNDKTPKIKKTCFDIVHNNNIHTFNYIYDKNNPEDWIITTAKDYHRVDSEFECFISASIDAKIKATNSRKVPEESCYTKIAGLNKEKYNNHFKPTNIASIKKHLYFYKEYIVENEKKGIFQFFDDNGHANNNISKIFSTRIEECFIDKGAIEKEVEKHENEKLDKFTKIEKRLDETGLKNALYLHCDEDKHKPECLYKIYDRIKNEISQKSIALIKESSTILANSNKITHEIKSLFTIEKFIEHGFHEIENLNGKSLKTALKFVLDVEINCKTFKFIVPKHKKAIVTDNLDSYKKTVYKSAFNYLSSRKDKQAEKLFHNEIKAANQIFIDLDKDKSLFSKAKRVLAAAISNTCAALTLGIAHALHKKSTGHFGFFTATNSQREVEKLSNFLESNFQRAIKCS